MINSKSQMPNPKQIPNSKFQIPKQRSLGKRIIIFTVILFISKFSWAQETGYLWENFLKGEYNTVAETTEEILKRLPQEKISSELYYLLGISYLEMGYVSSARKNLGALLERYSHSEWSDSAKLALGDCFLVEQEFEKAIQNYQDFIERNKKSPLHSLAYFKLAEAKRKSGLWDEARLLHEKIKNSFPSSLEASLSSELLSRNEFYFTFQAGSFINGENARELMQKLNTAGFSAYITETVKLGQVFYRVRVGRFLSRKESEETKEKLGQAGYTVRLYP